MKKLTTSALLLALTGLAQAQEVGQVISRVAVYQQVAVPRQSCSQTPVAVQAPSSGAGALMGAIAGGAVGSQIGGGTGQALATMVGVVGGSILGDRIENPGPQIQNQTTCTTQNFMENRLVGYNVVYEYAGKQYTVQLPQDPGPTIQLQVTPAGTAHSDAGTTAPVMVAAPQTVIAQPSVVYVPSPVYSAYPPIYTNLSFGWGWGGGYYGGGYYGGGYRRGHWR
ncbi:MAG: glycine zipper 2TM domain-containing protein [Limnohabitans sp.]